MKSLISLIFALCFNGIAQADPISAPNVSINHKAMAIGLCDSHNHHSQNIRASCHRRAAQIYKEDLYTQALELCVGEFSENARNSSDCFQDAAEKAEFVAGGGPIDGISKKTRECANKEITSNATQNEIVQCQKDLFVAAKNALVKKVGKTNGSSIKASPANNAKVRNSNANKAKSKSAK